MKQEIIIVGFVPSAFRGSWGGYRTGGYGLGGTAPGVMARGDMFPGDAVLGGRVLAVYCPRWVLSWVVRS